MFIFVILLTDGLCLCLTVCEGGVSSHGVNPLAVFTVAKTEYRGLFPKVGIAPAARN